MFLLTMNILVAAERRHMHADAAHYTYLTDEELNGIVYGNYYFGHYISLPNCLAFPYYNRFWKERLIIAHIHLVA